MIRTHLDARKLAIRRVERLAALMNAITSRYVKQIAAELPDEITADSLRHFSHKSSMIYARLKAEIAQVFAQQLETLSTLTYADSKRLARRRLKKKVKIVQAESILQEAPKIPIEIGVLPKPNLVLLQRIVGISPTRITKVASGNRVTNLVTQAISQAWDRRKIASELERVFNADKVTARRIARTEGLRVATESSLAVTEQLRDMVPAYRINAVLDTRTRPEHRHRNGQVYYRNPQPGQKGFAEMPRPPLEPDNTIAYNCRCFLTPVFA